MLKMLLFNKKIVKLTLIIIFKIIIIIITQIKSTTIN